MGRVTKAFAATALVMAGTVSLCVLAVRNMGRVEGAPILPVSDDEGDVIAQTSRGAYLMTVLDCNACHTPRDATGQPIPGMSLAGHPADAPLPRWDPSMLEGNILMTMDPTGTSFAGPWGVAVAPNLTPDVETGIGRLSADQLIESWRSGRHWAVDRAILPPMPAPAYAGLTDEDIRALHAFLMTLPAVRNAAPASVPAGE